MKNLYLFALILSAFLFFAACKPLRENVTPDGAQQMLRLRGYEVNTNGFFRAIAADDVAAIRTFYQAQFDPNVLNEKGETPLTFAIGCCEMKTFRALLEKVDINLAAKDGMTPLYLALKKSDKREFFDLLLQKGADVKKPAKDDSTVLHLAAFRSDAALIRDLVARGADVNAVDKVEANIPLIESCISRNPDMEIIKFFIEKGADINQQGTNKATCLIYIAANGNDTAAAELLKLGADPKLTDKDGKTALDWATKFERQKVIAVLRGK